MPIQSSLTTEMRELYDTESSRLQNDFFATKNGLGYVRQRMAVVLSIAQRFLEQSFPSEHARDSGAVVLATGDFGRQSLFPLSDVDLLFLFASPDLAARKRSRSSVSRNR